MSAILRLAAAGIILCGSLSALAQTAPAGSGQSERKYSYEPMKVPGSAGSGGQDQQENSSSGYQFDRVTVPDFKSEEERKFGTWKEEPAPYAQERLVLSGQGDGSATLINFQTPALAAATKIAEAEASVKAALALEGITGVRFGTTRVLDGAHVEVFRTLAKAPDLSMRVWVFSGKKGGQPVRGIAISSISSQGMSIEALIASQREYNRLGTVLPAAAKFAQVDLTKLDAYRAKDDWNRLSDEEAAARMEVAFNTFIESLVRRGALKGMADQQQLQTLLGLDQMTPWGLQDPMYEW